MLPRRTVPVRVMPRRNLPSAPPQGDMFAPKASALDPHRLFFALVPDGATRRRMAEVAASLQATHPELRARWQDAGRYHATLHFLGDHLEPRPDLVAAARRAVSGVRAAPFEWTLDQAAGFRGERPPCVLLGSETPEPMQRLWQDLHRALVLAGLGATLARNFTPHVTLAYGSGAMLPPTAIAPLVWRVERVVLILHSPERDYELLAEWRCGD